MASDSHHIAWFTSSESNPYDTFIFEQEVNKQVWITMLVWVIKKINKVFIEFII
jgi:hypothetical protein